jgi:hypothetical protein
LKRCDPPYSMEIEKPDNSLLSFLNRHEYQLTAIGAFAGLMAYSSTLSSPWGSILFLPSFLIFIYLSTILVASIPSDELDLFSFKLLMILLILTFSLYGLSKFFNLAFFALWSVLFIYITIKISEYYQETNDILISFLCLLTRPIKWFDKISNMDKGELHRKTMTLVTSIIVIIVCILIAAVATILIMVLVKIGLDISNSMSIFNNNSSLNLIPFYLEGSSGYNF